MSETQDLIIDRIAALGDGVASTPEGNVFLPFVLPGERVRAQIGAGRAQVIEVLEPSPDRIAPICRHFTHCGGCATQHMAAAAEQAWKSDLVATAMSQQRVFDPASFVEATRDGLADVKAKTRAASAIQPIVASPIGTRRRAVFAARRTKSGAIVGFHEQRSHDIVDLMECPILSPQIANRLDGLRAMIAPLLSRSGEARMTVTLADNGVDVVLEDTKPELTFDERAKIAELARAARIIRLTVKGEIIFATGEPLLRFGRVDVTPAPGVFLQAVPAVEARMTEIILAAVGKSKRVADLFSGLGTFSFPLAERAEVLAVDGDNASIACLIQAVKRAQGIKPVIGKVRDLFQEPLSAKELEPFDAVVFDPPRAGADAQARMLAKSKVPIVVAVSCAPATLARDLKTLIAGGYVLQSITPIDQFVFSPHVEAIAILKRPKR
ncbi:MAG: class I SAM-dependent RNA methyltransferase [Hyphomicrobiaceae bacterium]